MDGIKRKSNAVPTTAAEVRALLPTLAEEAYRRFTCGLLPGVDGVLGVRMPHLRRIARAIAKADWLAFLAEADADTHESVLLRGLVIGMVPADVDTIRPYVQAHVETLDNWSVCDTFCSALKIARTQPEAMWALIRPYYDRESVYALRFAVVMTLVYYLDDACIDRSLALLDSVRHEAYYVRMAVAWAVSMAYVAQPGRTEAYLARCTLDDWTYNKALQKITESRQIDDATRAAVRAMKRRRMPHAQA